MIRRPPRSTQSRSSAASDVYNRQALGPQVIPAMVGNLSKADDGLLMAMGLVSSFLDPVSYTHLRAHETVLELVCRLLTEKKKLHKNESPLDYSDN